MLTMNGHSFKPLLSLLMAISLCSSVAQAEDSKPEAQQTDDLPLVTVASVTTDDFTTTTHISGTLQAREEVLVSPQISGYAIEKINVDVGDKVAVGDVLIVLNKGTLRAQLAQANADIAKANAGVRQAVSQSESSKASLNKAYASLKRNQKLRRSGTIPLMDLEETQAAAGVAKASYDSAKQGIVTAKAQLTQAESLKQVAALNLSRATITAKVAGLVSKRNAKLGEIANSAGTPLLTIIKDAEVELEANVIETALTTIKVGDQVEVGIAGVGIQKGTVRAISPVIDPQTRLGSVNITLPKNPNIRAGGFAQGWVNIDTKKAKVVPATAVQASGNGHIVTVVNDGVIEKRPVVVGALFKGKREIISGLSDSDKVLVKAGGFYNAGDKVRVAQ